MNELSKELISEITKIRRHLHKIAELSYKEYETTSYIQQILTKLDLKFQKFKNLETGGFCEMGHGPCLLFRCDIDALPIKENPDHKIISKNDDTMHACGHDFHIALGLGLLRYFQNYQDSLKGKLRVIFQPAEEAAPGGAEYIIKENIFHDAQHILGVHVDNQHATGKVILSKKAASASSTSIKINLKGPGGHTSRPDETVDLIHVCGEYITQLKSHLTNSIDPRETLVVAFGKIAGGDKHNAMPQNIFLRGTLRTHKNQVDKKARKIISSFSSNFEKLYGIKIDLEFPTSCPATINDPSLVEKFIQSMQESQQSSNLIFTEKPSMGADDFAVYLEKIPGLYLRVGGKSKGEPHTGAFRVSEDLIEPALNYLTGFIQYYFEQM